MGSIYNLTYELKYQNGHSIVFTEYDQKSLTPVHINTVQLKMMQSNNIPHFLPLSIENMNMTTKLHYDITSKQRILSYFRSSGASMNDYYHVFLTLIKTLENCGAYMLNQDNFILDTDFIYIGSQAEDISLVYLPIKGVTKETSINDDMKKLLTDIAGEVEGLQGNEFKSILSYIKNPSFSLGGLKKLLLELISLRSNVNGFNAETSFGYGAQSVTMQEQAVNQSRNIPNNNHQVEREVKSDTKVQEEFNTAQKKKAKLPPLSSRSKVYLFAATMLAIAIIWKLYEIRSTSTMFTVSSGLSALVLILVYVYWKIWRPGVKPIPAVETDENEQDKAIPHQKRPVRQDHATPVQRPKPPINQPYGGEQIEQDKQSLRVNHAAFKAHQTVAAGNMDTTLLEEDADDTVLLEENMRIAQEEPVHDHMPLLTRTSENEEPSQIKINATNFLIGRNKDTVNYVEDALGVSRVHAEIIKIDSMSYGLKDLGSKNGSTINGNAMVPFKVYALNENDEFTLGKATYTFNWSKNE
ncbi:DUF6382 domain-containing protein [Virgibacillus sp. LDC-1]|uniref:DUF6382 domain-containing protein n=1 Tax=Virgibacillus sp. LDC-1 TaxID=3039856 RepID=UPI0024DE430A|nr:DUF6382 domain-containing protein [Virgibacillus sp. LDC-1]